MNIPNSGETFEWRGNRYVALGPEQGGLLAVSEGIVALRPFDERGCNDWRSSSLRAWLNGPYLIGIGGADGLLPFTSDLTADDGMKDYGTAEDMVFILSDSLYRKYRPFLPGFDVPRWSITPWSCRPANSSNVRNVYPDGTLDDYYARNAFGVVAGLLLNHESLEER